MVKNKKKSKENPFVPDEIITNILIKFPVKSLVRFQLVCKKWRDQISCDFVDLHQRSILPLILALPNTIWKEFAIFGIDKWWDLSRTRSMIHRYPFHAADISPALINFSHAGLVVLEASPWFEAKISILNPDECVEIFFSSEFWSGCRICAVYYHPLLGEYCSLWMKSGRPEPTTPRYELLTLGSKPSFKTIPYPFSYRAKNEYAPPLFINNHLYWMLKPEEQEKRFGGRNDILEFSIISEEFKVIPCPIPLNTECKWHQTRLLNSGGDISFVLILPSTITVWRLEDRVQQLWKSIAYTPSSVEINAYGIISIVDEKLAFESFGRLFVCNLMEGTLKNVPKRKWYNGNVLFFSHQMTLASLNKCKSPLYIDKDGKVSWSGKSTV